jgi:hypothetical protein
MWVQTYFVSPTPLDQSKAIDKYAMIKYMHNNNNKYNNNNNSRDNNDHLDRGHTTKDMNSSHHTQHLGTNHNVFNTKDMTIQMSF